MYTWTFGACVSSKWLPESAVKGSTKNCLEARYQEDVTGKRGRENLGIVQLEA